MLTNISRKNYSNISNALTIIISKTYFNIDYLEKIFLDNQISISELFLKDHVTLKQNNISQFSPPNTQDIQPTTSTAQTRIFSFCPLTEAEVSKLLSSHPTTCPLDPIPSHLLQAISPTLLPAFTHIINTSLVTGTFPTAFKQARVTSLLKKPTLNTSLLENYRPISLLPFIAKILKLVLFNQVSLFLSQNNKLDANQSGFRSGHSTETVLLSVTEALQIAKADFKSSVLILLDLSAAFGALSSLDITWIPLHWFESYLTGRSFEVTWGGEASKPHQLVTGVPQGSFLGPFLFSTYIKSQGQWMMGVVVHGWCAAVVWWVATRFVTQVQRLSYVDQLTLLCIFNSFSMKHYFYIDSMDLLHLKKSHGFIAFWGEKNISFI